jgi:hypothetical protein
LQKNGAPLGRAKVYLQDELLRVKQDRVGPAISQVHVHKTLA